MLWLLNRLPALCEFCEEYRPFLLVVLAILCWIWAVLMSRCKLD